MSALAAPQITLEQAQQLVAFLENGEQQQANGVEYTIETPDDLVKQLERRA